MAGAVPVRSRPGRPDAQPGARHPPPPWRVSGHGIRWPHWGPSTPRTSSSTPPTTGILVAMPVFRRFAGPDRRRRPHRQVRRPRDVQLSSCWRPSFRSCWWRSAAPSDPSRWCSPPAGPGRSRETVFAVGIPFVSAWYEPSRAASPPEFFGGRDGRHRPGRFSEPAAGRLDRYFPTHLLIAGVLAVMAALVWFLMKNPPAGAQQRPVLPKLLDAAKTPITWKMSSSTPSSSGGFVSFATYLPTYLRDVYSFDPSAAGARTAGFALPLCWHGRWARPADRSAPNPWWWPRSPAFAVLAWVVNLQPDGTCPPG